MNTGGAAALRHDLRTPLNQIIGYCDLLSEDVTDSGDLSLIDQVNAAANRARAIFDQLQQLASIAPEHDFQQRATEVLCTPAAELSSLTQSLASRSEPVLHPFAGHIAAAARHFANLLKGRAPDCASSVQTPTPFTTAGAGARLLAVDDNERNREVLANQLARQGYAVQSVPSADEALRLLRSEPFDLVLLDVQMPGTSGFDALEIIKADPQLRDIPVVMVSAMDEYAGVIRCIESGAEDYLSKPIDPVLLRARLKASLDKKALRDEQRRKTEELEAAYNHLRQAQTQLLAQERLASLGSLAAGIAHEIKNPLNFVTNFASLSRDLVGELKAIETLPPEAGPVLDDLAANVQRIEEHGRRADRIVRGLLGHARKQPGAREMTDINQLAAEAVQLAYHGLRSQDMSFQARITTDLDPFIGTIACFPQDLSRVFVNVAVNGFYALQQQRQRAGASDRPELKLTTRNSGDFVEVRIRDNGPGIPKAILPRVFDAFFSTKPAGEGTGLGLSISKDVVTNEHHGHLEVESREGEYTEFLIRLPRTAPAL